jgi:hypothetical protein
MLKHRGSCPGPTMLKHRAATQSRAADAETQRKPPGPTMLKHKGSRYTVSGQQATRSTNHRSYIRMLTQSRAQFTWLKQPANCDAETTSAATRRSCYSSRNNNTSFSTCNSILLRETRTSYSGLESRSD